jgi:hypothetical protein
MILSSSHFYASGILLERHSHFSLTWHPGVICANLVESGTILYRQITELKSFVVISIFCMKLTSRNLPGIINENDSNIFFVLAQNYKTEQKEGKCVIPLLYSYLSLHGNISASLVLEDIFGDKVVSCVQM